MHRKNEPPENAVVIVLGARVCRAGKDRPQHLSRAFQYRADAAAAYLKAHPNAVCITTGGQGADEPCTEGDAAKDALVKLGIAPERIFTETRSETTLENLRFARAILRENGLPDAVVIATQGYHLWRTVRMAKMLGLTPYPLRAETNLKSLPKNLCREALAVLKFLLFTRKE